MNIEDNLKVIKLIDAYGSLLTSKKFEIMTNYYFDNLSLSEIGDNYGISRQAVRDSISQSIKSLQSFEEKLQVIQRQERIQAELMKISSKYPDMGLKEEIGKIIEELRG